MADINDTTTEKAALSISENVPTFEDRKKFWKEYGNRGLSSMLIYETLSGEHNVFPSSLQLFLQNDELRNQCFPRDASDFRRCHELLELFPEWRDTVEFDKLRNHSPVWNNLVTIWPKLTKLYMEKKYNELSEMIDSVTPFRSEQ